MAIITENGILLNQKFSNKKEVLRKLSELSVELGISSSKNEVFKSYVDRENEGLTGMMNNFAIPHAKSSSVKTAQILFIRNENDIEDWETLDESKVNLIISLLIPEDNNEEHLKLLANISRKLMNEENIEILKNAKTKDEILKLLSII
ncbi:fructose PTS transporter subunit IIA [Helcococcus ovis]|uniref:PTS fructose transporter subunit IIA n=2 Tax=Helcococcus TaxID=31983 RepID=A0A4R9C333_9FIRM|nr:fructose PTS transporter subunit IIA [Helcococcus ovis]TFF65536.1 PTS fructose transporter subunit IIA [Helcococcus ovis]TFF67640.1 PTS fructose transporter subunit IIA [Helcococcus ovis]